MSSCQDALFNDLDDHWEYEIECKYCKSEWIAYSEKTFAKIQICDQCGEPFNLNNIKKIYVKH